MASFNHHPYLSDVLDSLQKRQMHLASVAASMHRSESEQGAALFVELPWTNETAEWAALEAARQAALSSGEGGASSLLSRVTGVFNVDGTSGAERWEDDDEEMKHALKMAGELVPDTTPQHPHQPAHSAMMGAEQQEQQSTLGAIGSTLSSFLPSSSSTNAPASSSSLPPLPPLPGGGQPIQTPERIPNAGEPTTARGSKWTVFGANIGF